MASTSTAEPSSGMKKRPNWLEMPHELMVNIFQRLRPVEILNNTRKVCTTWRRICKYPEMWKVIDLGKQRFDNGWDPGLNTLIKEAVDLSCGELIDISIYGFGTNELLQYIVLRSSKLKRLCLVSCYMITGSALSEAVKRVPQLEELHLISTQINAHDVEVIGRNCPQLKSFRMETFNISTYINCDDNALAVANHMPELRHLEVIDSGMTNDGLKAILNGCPHLESLDVSKCYNLDLDGDLGKLCNERIKDFKDNSRLKSFLEVHYIEGDCYDEIL